MGADVIIGLDESESVIYVGDRWVVQNYCIVVVGEVTFAHLDCQTYVIFLMIFLFC